MELKKTRKKALALVLAACVTGTSSAPVFAAEDLFTDTPVVETPDFGTEAASTGNVYVEQVVFNDSGNYISVDVKDYIDISGYIEENGEMKALVNAKTLESYLPANYELVGESFLVRNGYIAADIRKKTTVAVKEIVFNDNGKYITVNVNKALNVAEYVEDVAYISAENLKGYLPANYELKSTDNVAVRDGYVAADIQKKTTVTVKEIVFNDNGKYITVNVDKALNVAEYVEDVAYISAEDLKGYLPANYELKSTDNVAVRDGYVAADIQKKTIEVGYLRFSGEGMETVQTEVKLGTTVPLINFLGKVPEGKVFAGWTLDGKKVYAAGESFTFDKAFAQDMGTSADGVQGYLFSFKAAFDASEKKINVVFKTKTGNVISNKAMMVPYTEKYVDASKLTAPKGYKLVSEGNLRIVGDNVTAIVTKISSSVSRKRISTLSFRGVAAAYEQTGKQIRPRVTIKDGRKVLKLNKDYTITYKNNIKRGRASIIIKGKNNYYGTKTITFRIVSKGLR